MTILKLQPGVRTSLLSIEGDVITAQCVELDERSALALFLVATGANIIKTAPDSQEIETVHAYTFFDGMWYRQILCPNNHSDFWCTQCGVRYSADEVRQHESCDHFEQVTAEAVQHALYNSVGKHTVEVTIN